MSKVPTIQHLQVRLPAGLATAELEPALCGYVRFLLKRAFPECRLEVEMAHGEAGSMTLDGDRPAPPVVAQALSFALSVWEEVFAQEVEPMALARGLDCLCGGDHELPPLPESLEHDLETWRQGGADEAEGREAEDPLEG